ncbi:MAG: LUD domain-containing protein [Ferruginibacter sp.]|nr:LUD domain-containing protein [Ferruginibacter sp.]
MSSREKILQAISANKPAFMESPEMNIKGDGMDPAATLQQFIKTLEGIGGKALLVSDIDIIRNELKQSRDSSNYIVNTIALLGEVNNEINPALDANSLEPVYKTYIEATIGVAENGSVWLYESQMKNRLLPYICQHLIICLDAKRIVPTMHEAYQQIDVAKEGYGVFLAGPSKTADIEQSLVIGAHGARSLMVYLIDLDPTPDS